MGLRVSYQDFDKIMSRSSVGKARRRRRREILLGKEIFLTRFLVRFGPMSSTNLAEPGELSMINYEATQDVGNYLGKEVDITSIAAPLYSVLLPVRCFPDEERDQETFLVLTRRSHQSRDSLRSSAGCLRRYVGSSYELAQSAAVSFCGIKI